MWSRDPAPPWGWSCQQCPSPRQDCPSAFPLPLAPLGWSGLSSCADRWGLNVVNLNVLMSETSRPQPSCGCSEGTHPGVAVSGGRAKDVESLGIILERGNRGRGVPDSPVPGVIHPANRAGFRQCFLKKIHFIVTLMISASKRTLVPCWTHALPWVAGSPEDN